MKGTVLIGPPCCGKSTICDILCSMCGKYVHISSGDIARKMAYGDADAMASLNAGNMAPEDEMRAHVLDEIHACIDNEEDFILDGFPRNIDQARYLEECGIHLRYIKLIVGDDVIMERARYRMRGDDMSIAKRLEYYKENTEPIMCCPDIHGMAFVMCGEARCDAYMVDNLIQGWRD